MAMAEWWSGLTGLNQFFYAGAAFFSVFLLWQLVASLTGLSADHDVDGGVGHPGDLAADPHGADAADTAMAFKLLSVRSIISFFTLFCWGAALYLNRGDTPVRALTYAMIWGLTGMALVSLILWGMRRLVSVGNLRLESCVGTDGTVYVNIPANGMGEVRVEVGGVVSYVKARTVDGQALKAGAAIRVARKLTANTVMVEPLATGGGVSPEA
jgi:hypothetical protein